MSILRFLYNQGVIALQTVKSLLLVTLFSRPVSQSDLGHISEGRECVVIGSGPSLKGTLAEHLSFIKQRDVVCTNNFIASPLFINIRPRYYVLMDRAFWLHSTSARLQDEYRQYAQKMVDVVDWPMTIFLPQAARHWNYFQEVPRKNSRVSICYVNTTQVASWTWLKHLLYRRQMAMPTMQNVLVAALFLSVNLRYRNVYLVGGDHSWHQSLYVDEHNRLFLKNTGFQDEDERSYEPFYEDPAEKKPYMMYNLLRDLSRMYLGYMEVEHYAKERGTMIRNASSKSFIDAFPHYTIPHESA